MSYCIVIGWTQAFPVKTQITQLMNPGKLSCGKIFMATLKFGGNSLIRKFYLKKLKFVLPLFFHIQCDYGLISRSLFFVVNDLNDLQNSVATMS